MLIGNGNPAQPPAPLVMNVGMADDKVVIQVMSTLYLEPEQARGIAAQLVAIADQCSRSIIISAGSMDQPVNADSLDKIARNIMLRRPDE